MLRPRAVRAAPRRHACCVRTQAKRARPNEDFTLPGFEMQLLTQLGLAGNMGLSLQGLGAALGTAQVRLGQGPRWAAPVQGLAQPFLAVTCHSSMARVGLF